MVAAVADFSHQPSVMAPSTPVMLFGGVVLLFLGSAAAQDAGSEDSDVTEELVALMGARE